MAISEGYPIEFLQLNKYDILKFPTSGIRFSSSHLSQASTISSCWCCRIENILSKAVIFTLQTIQEDINNNLMVNGNTFRDSNSFFLFFFFCLPFHLRVNSLRTEFAPMGSKFFPSRVGPNLDRESKIGLHCKNGGKTKKCTHMP